MRPAPSRLPRTSRGDVIVPRQNQPDAVRSGRADRSRPGRNRRLTNLNQGCAILSPTALGNSAMSAKPAQSSTAAAPRPTGAAGSEARAPLCFVIDGDASIRHFLSLILHGAGIDTVGLADGAELRSALARRAPDLIFLNIALESSEAIECVLTL